MMNTKKTGRVMDLDVALARVDGDRQLLAELSTMFRQGYPRLLNEARNAILQNDHAGLERAAHTLQGRLAFFGIHELHERVLRLEMMARMNDLTHAGQLLTEVETEMESILPEFESLSRELNP